MEKLIRNLLLLIVLLNICYIALVLLMYCGPISKHNAFDYLNQYNATLNNIKQDSSNRKIIFIGGSNLAFGLNTERIESEINIPTYNFGIHGGIGIDKPISDIKPYISPKDIIVLSPEYANILNPYNHSNEKYYVDFLSSDYFSLFYSINHYTKFLVFVKRSIHGYLFNNNHIKTYNVNWFNNNGDVIEHLNKPQKPISERYGAFDVNKIKKFKEYLDQKLSDTLTYYFVPPVTNEFKFKGAQAQNVDKQFSEYFLDKYPIKLEKMTFKNDCFFDTQYHLISECRKTRTDVILMWLKGLNKKEVAIK